MLPRTHSPSVWNGIIQINDVVKGTIGHGLRGEGQRGRESGIRSLVVPIYISKMSPNSEDSADLVSRCCSGISYKLASSDWTQGKRQITVGDNLIGRSLN